MVNWGLPMNNLRDRNFNPDSIEGEFKVVEMWSAIRPERLKAGAMAGIVAAIATLVFGMIYCAVVGQDLLAPFKIAAIPFLGNGAMAYGTGSGFVMGTVVFLIYSMISGMVYSHFTGVNSRKGLLGVGVTWGAFSWVFISCLFLPANRAYYAAEIPKGTMFFAWMVFGLSLSSVAMFDKVGYQFKNSK